MTSTRRTRGAWLAAALAVLCVLGGVELNSIHRCAGRCHQVAEVRDAGPILPDAPEPAKVLVSPESSATNVNPTAPISVTAASGAITEVTMVNDAGKDIPGGLSGDGKRWTPTQMLGYGHTYTLNISAKGPSGMPTRETSSFTTVNPDQVAALYLNTVANIPIQDGGTYGIGTVIRAHFDQPIGDMAAAEKALTVTTNPPVKGSWHWIDDSTLHWRPEHYYAPGTTVSVTSKMYGVKLGPGEYGAQDDHVNFRIGDAHVSVVDDKDKQVRVYDNGKLVRTMPTSMGMGGTETIGKLVISFWTPRGIYTVMDKANPVLMDSSTFGLPINSRLGYKEKIPWATRISTDGIYMHELDTTIWAQGNTNTSHGCLNLNGENAKWFYDFSLLGDVVEIRGTGGPPQRMDQNGDWSMPWAQWVSGSALNNPHPLDANAAPLPGPPPLPPPPPPGHAPPPSSSAASPGN